VDGAPQTDPQRPGADTATAVQFAVGLRQLRTGAGNPSYRQLARSTHYAPSTLVAAFAGRRLPTREVAVATAVACGGDAAEWAARWSAAAHRVGHPSRGYPDGPPPQGPTPQASGPGSTDPGSAAGDAPTTPAGKPPTAAVEDSCPDLTVRPTPSHPVTSQPVRSGDERGEPRAKRPGRRAAAVAGAVAATALVGAAAVTAFHPSTAGSAGPVPHRPVLAATSPASAAVVDGADPTTRGCTADAVIAAAHPLTTTAGSVLGTLTVEHSARCQASWARFAPTPDLAVTPTVLVEVVITRPADQTLAAFQYRFDGRPVYGDALLTTTGCVQAAATLHWPGHTAPPVRAVTSCR